MPKPTYLIDEASELMLTVTYPALMDTMKDLGLTETVIEINGFYDMHLTTDGRLYFFNSGRQQNNISENILQEKKDPQIKLIKPTNGYDFPTDAYVSWCDKVADKIEELKKHLTKLDKVIHRMSKIPVSYTREILFEKYKIS